MGKKHQDPYFWGMHPTPLRWEQEQWRVFERVALPKIKAVINELPMVDLLMFTYLIGLNHAFYAMEQSKEKTNDRSDE